MLRWIPSLVLLLAVASCVNPDLPAGGYFICTPQNPLCPDGFECRNNKCVESKSAADASGDVNPVTDGPVTDSPVSDAPLVDGPPKPDVLPLDSFQKKDSGPCGNPPTCKVYKNVGGKCVLENAKAGTLCSDGQACTYKDMCDGNGKCAGKAYACAVGTCYSSTCLGDGTCKKDYHKVGTVCSDNDKCTVSDKCDALHKCVGQPIFCRMVTGTTMYLNAVWGSSEKDVFAVGYNGTILHFDGSSWKAQKTCLSTSTFRGVWGSSSTNVFAVGNNSKMEHYNGTKWSCVNHLLSTKTLRSVWGSGPTSVYAVGDGSTVFHYDGSGWSKEFPTSGSYYFYGVRAGRLLASETAVLAGSSGKAYKRTSTGWQSIATSYPNSLYAVDMLLTTTYYAVGQSGLALKFSGNSWAKLGSTGTTEALYGVHAFSTQDIFAVGGKGTILRYDGSKWTKKASGTTATLNDVWGKGNSVFVVGSSGVILRYKKKP